MFNETKYNCVRTTFSFYFSYTVFRMTQKQKGTGITWPTGVFVRSIRLKNHIDAQTHLETSKYLILFMPHLSPLIPDPLNRELADSLR